ncbi:MAG: M14 family metallopeptidase [Balneolaceae bacterium]
MKFNFFKRLTLTLALFLTLNFIGLQAQNTLQSPGQFLGYELGERFTPHHRVLSYMKHVAENSDRVTLQQYGTTYEGRELVYLILTHARNHTNIEEIRTNNLKLTGLMEGNPTENLKAIVWLSYNVHGNEASSSEAAMKTLHELANPYNTQAARWLNNTVVILDPMLNPDGRDRYVNWYNRTAGKSFNPVFDAREHHEPWPGGRTNHYYFDLNRDWAWRTQTESEQRIPVYQQWMPHVHVDFHEQGYNAPYYFAPAAEPFHKAITDWQREFQTTIGQNHTEYFNEEGWLYFTREIFDLFYPSYGDTWPTFNGAIGMTYEQAGHSQAGLGIIKQEGDTLTLKNRLTRHHITGISTVETTSQQSRRVISEFQSHFRRANNSPEGEYKTYIIKGDNPPDKIHNLLTFLDQNQIFYGQAGTGRNLEAYNFTTGQPERIRVEQNDILVSAYQPQSQLVRVLFEPRPELADSLTYDITAWETHYRFGLKGYASASRMEPGEEVLPDTYRTFTEIGEAERPYAYLVPWQSMDDARFLAEITGKGIKTRFSSIPFTIDEQEYEAGTLIITRAGNQALGDRFDEIVSETAQNHSRRLHRAESGFVENGSDFGSSNVRYLESPDVAVLSGAGTSPNSTGEIWHFFDRQLHYPATLIDTDHLPHADLDQFNVLIMPSGSYDEKITDDTLKRIREWVQNGGRLIAVGQANRILAGKEGFALKEKITSEETDSTESRENLLKVYAEQDRESVRNSNPGSIFRITLDNTHPLAFGYEETYHSLKLDAEAYRYLEDGWNVGTVRSRDAHLSGFVGHQAKSKLEHSLTFGVEPMGSGVTVYMIDNPLFRGFWENGKLLFVNAVFMTGQ